MRHLSLLLAAALILVCVPGCGDGEEVQQIKDGLSQTWDGVTAWTVKNRDEAQAWFDKNRPALEAQFEAAKKKAGELSGEAATAVEASWKNLSEKLVDLEKAGEGEWEKARDAVAKAYESFQTEMKRAEAEEN